MGILAFMGIGLIFDLFWFSEQDRDLIFAALTSKLKLYLLYNEIFIVTNFRLQDIHSIKILLKYFIIDMRWELGISYSNCFLQIS